MWRYLRIAILLFVLATVAQTAWLAGSRSAEWKTPLRVAIYPIASDASAATAKYIADLRKDDFEPLEAFFGREAAKLDGENVMVLLLTQDQPPLQAKPANADNSSTLAAILDIAADGVVILDRAGRLCARHGGDGGRVLRVDVASARVAEAVIHAA